MRRSIALALMGLFLWAAPAAASIYEARLFIDAMVGGVAARPEQCPEVVVQVTEMRQMAVVCARYDGSFDDFREAWSASMRSSVAGRDRYPTSRSEAKSRTSWEKGDGHYERIYAVGETIVGVRFTDGDILFVYK